MDGKSKEGRNDGGRKEGRMNGWIDIERVWIDGRRKDGGGKDRWIEKDGGRKDGEGTDRWIEEGRKKGSMDGRREERMMDGWTEIVILLDTIFSGWISACLSYMNSGRGLFFNKCISIHEVGISWSKDMLEKR